MQICALLEEYQIGRRKEMNRCDVDAVVRRCMYALNHLRQTFDPARKADGKVESCNVPPSTRSVCRCDYVCTCMYVSYALRWNAAR